MSELFTYKGDDEHYFIKTKNKHLTGDEVADLLNSLSEENEKLTKMLNANYKINNELVQYIQMLERDNDE